MPDIQVLSTHVADLIAAGEVVERPASVVKELCENAVDAGAKSVTVEIQNGGMSLIRVTDDGKGIAPDEVETAFLRHATSKIRSEYDLEAIGTLGFRGEALAAIAAVSRLEVLTRRPADDLGVSLTLEGGVKTDREEAGCPAGTTMLVRDLFYNTPARLKFMKKDAAEGAACLAAVQRQALSHPEVAFKFIRDGKQELLTPGDGQLRSAMYAVLGRDMALGFVPVEGSGEDIQVSGFVSQPTCCRGNRGYQFFFVNGRYIKSQTLTAALEQAYANQRMVGKFPGCVLHLTVKLNRVDVNVHPTKQEVKFGAERQVFSAVYYAVLAALGADKSRPAVTVGTAAKPPAESYQQTSLPLHDFTNHGTAGTVLTVPEGQKDRPSGPFTHPAGPVSAPAAEVPSRPVPQAEVRSPRRADPVQSVGTAQKPDREGATVFKESPPAPAQADFPPVSKEPPPRIEETPPAPAADAAQTDHPVSSEEEPWRIAGELFRTYILVEQGDKVLLIDKHAAHERMNFDRMRSVDYTPMSQTLIAPVVYTPAPEEAAILLDHLAELDRVGFEVEDFGGGSLAVRRVPDYVDMGEVEAALGEIAGKLALTGTTGETERMDEIYHTMACKAAIKGGWKNAPEELERVAKAVISGEVKYCPHGRPVCIELPRTELEKQFKRRP
ncbi:MAG: DNA mismatch repair endonuclease MutL [Oscillospiraceae bacterium]|nr:DNA mismatch repair endonuclease MutL [Oscillospiraceae bacterium]